MNKVIVFLCYSLLLSKLCADTSTYDAFKDYAQQAMQTWKTPGLATAIIKDGRVHYITLGETKLGSRQPINTTTLFCISSLTKTMTATVVAILVDKGLLNWDDPIKKHIPTFQLHDPVATEKLTIRHALGHSTGLPHFSGDSFMRLGFAYQKSLSSLAHIGTKNQFGKDYGYQNLFYGMFKHIIEKVTHKKYEEVMQELLFKPLNMTHTFCGPPKRSFWNTFNLFKRIGSAENFTSPHRDTHDGVRATQIKDAFFIYTSSKGVISCIEDMAKWAQFCMEGNTAIVSQKNFAELTKTVSTFQPKELDLQFPHTRIRKEVSYGIGRFIYAYGPHNTRIVSHMAGWDGYRALMTLVPSQKTAIITLANHGGLMDSLLPEGLQFWFLDHILKIPERYDWTKHIHDEIINRRHKNKEFVEQDEVLHLAQPRSNLAMLTGTYTNAEIYGSIQIKQERQKLFFYYNKQKIPLKRVYGDRFAFNPLDLSQSFSVHDIAYIDFMRDARHQSLLFCSMMQEGINPWFKKHD